MKNLMKLFIISCTLLLGLIITNRVQAQYQFLEFALPGSPNDVVVDSDTNYYVAYLEGDSVVKYNAQMEPQFVINIDKPTSLTLDDDENLYLLAKTSLINKQKIFKYSKIDGSAMANPLSGLQQTQYTDFTYYKNHFYLIRSFYSKVIKYDTTGTVVFSVGDYGTSNGQYINVKSVTVDHEQNVYVVDDNINRITKLDSLGNYVAKVSTAANHVHCFKDSNLIVSYNHGVKSMKTDFSNIETLGTGVQGDSLSEFSSPNGICTYKNNICVADKSNSRIQVIDYIPEITIMDTVELASGSLINFGGIDIYQSSELKTLYIVNNGSDTLFLTLQTNKYIKKTGAQNPDYTVDESMLNPIIPPGDSTYFTVQLTPSYYNNRVAKLQIYSNDNDESVYTINLKGVGLLLDQTLTFDDIPNKVYGDAPFDLVASASSGLGVIFIKSSNAPISISGSTVTINGAGNTGIVAYQPGNGIYKSVQETKVLSIAKANQTIDFPAMANTPYLDTLVLHATSSSGLPVTYTSADTNIAKIVDTLLIAKGVGTTSITASQTGNSNYNPAPDSVRTIITIKATPNLSFTNPFANSVNRQYGSKFKLEAASNSTAPIKIIVDDPTILKITGDSAEVIGIGSSEIFAYVQANALFKYAEVAYNFSTVKADQTISFEPIPTLAYGQQYQLSAISSSGLQVVFSNSDGTIVDLNDETLTVVGIGSAEITAIQAGNQYYKAAPDSILSVTTVKANPAINFTSIGTKRFGDSKFKLSANDTSGLEITYSSSDESILSITGDSATILAADTVMVYATRTGNEFYEDLTVSQQLIIQKGNQELSFEALPVINYSDTILNLLASVSTGNNITFSIEHDTVATLNNNQLNVIGSGSVNVTAQVAATELYDEATATQTFMVNKAEQSITFIPVAELTYGDKPVKLTATSSAGLLVQLQSDNEAIATVQNDSLFIIGAGTFNLLASQNGDKNFNATTLSTSIAVNKANQEITFTKPEEAVYGTTISLVANASSGLPVSFTSNKTNVLSVTDSIATILGVDSVEVQITQAGNANYNSTQTSFNILTQKAQQQILFGALDTMTYGDVFVLSAEASSGLPVSYISSNENIVTVKHDTLNVVGVGEVKIIAHQAGNGFYHAADTLIQYMIVVKANQSITFANIPELIFGDGAIALNASSNAGLPIAFSISDESTATIKGDTLEIIGAGSATIVAVQSGNDFYNSAELSQSFTVNKAEQNLQFETLPAFTYGDAAVSLNAQVNTGLEITFKVLSDNVLNIEGNKAAIIGAGSTLVVAEQAGNNNYLSAADTQMVIVKKAIQNLQFDIIPQLTYGNEPIILSAQTNSGLSVSYRALNDSVLNIDGAIASIIGAGSALVVAEQIGNKNYKAIADTQMVIVNKAEQTISFELPDSVDIDDELILEASASSGLKVEFSLSSKSAVLIGNSIVITDYEPISIVAKQAGNKNYNASANITKTMVVRKPNALLNADGIENDTLYVDLGEIEVNTQVEKEIAVVNKGNGKLKLIMGESGYVNLNSPEGFNIDESGLVEVIAGKQQQVFSITFKPLVTGEFNSLARIIHSDPNKGDLIIILTGKGKETVSNISQDELSIKMYPNPTSDKFAIALDANENYYLSIYNSNGELVYSNENYKSGNFINVSHLHSGVYLVGIQNSKKRVRFSRLLVK